MSWGKGNCDQIFSVEKVRKEVEKILKSYGTSKSSKKAFSSKENKDRVILFTWFQVCYEDMHI